MSIFTIFSYFIDELINQIIIVVDNRISPSFSTKVECLQLLIANSKKRKFPLCEWGWVEVLKPTLKQKPELLWQMHMCFHVRALCKHLKGLFSKGSSKVICKEV